MESLKFMTKMKTKSKPSALEYLKELLKPPKGQVSQFWRNQLSQTTRNILDCSEPGTEEYELYEKQSLVKPHHTTLEGNLIMENYDLKKRLKHYEGICKKFKLITARNKE